MFIYDHGRDIWSDVNPTGDYNVLMAKSTMPGAGWFWRWDNATSPPDARIDIADWELLIGTASVPWRNPLDTSPTGWWSTHRIPYFRNFVENTWNNGDNGNGATMLLYATWGELDSPDEAQWREDLDYHEPFWETMADHGAANLPAGAYVYIIPANILMKKLYDDVQAGQAPTGITSINDYFSDNIHTNARGSYALALLHLAVIHHVNPNTVGDLAFDERFTPTPTSEQADYLKSVVWEIATSYSRTGVPSD